MEDVFCRRAFSIAHDFSRSSFSKLRVEPKLRASSQTSPTSFMDLLASSSAGSSSCFLQQGDSLVPFDGDGWWELPPLYSLPPSLRRLSIGGVRPASDSVLPCGLRATEAMDLMHRELGPEDYEMLSKLDEAVPKRDVAQASLVDSLPRIRGRRELAADCGICLAKLGGGDNKCAVRLPCEHPFHLECISKWVTQCKNACPLCSAPIDYQAAEQSSGVAAKEADADAAMEKKQSSTARAGGRGVDNAAIVG